MTSIHLIKVPMGGAPGDIDSSKGSIDRHQGCGFPTPDDAMEQLSRCVYTVPANPAKPGEELLPCVRPLEKPGAKGISSSCTCSVAAGLGSKRCPDCLSTHQEQQQIPGNEISSSAASSQRKAAPEQEDDLCSTGFAKQTKVQKIAQAPHPPQTPCQDIFPAGSSRPAATGGPESSSDKSTCSRNTPPTQLVDQEEQSQPLPVPLPEVGTICGATAKDAFGGGVDDDFFQDAAAAFTEMLQGVAAEDDGTCVAEEGEEEEEHDGCDYRGAFFVDGVEDLPEICCTSTEGLPGAPALEEDDGSQFFADAANAVAAMIEDAAADSSFGDELQDALAGGGGGSRGGTASSTPGQEGDPQCPSPVYYDCAPEEHQQQQPGNAASSTPDSETPASDDALPGPPPASSEGIDGVEPTFLDCITDIFPDSETDEPDMRGAPPAAAAAVAVDAPGVEPRVPPSPVHSHPGIESPKCTSSSPSLSFHDCEDIGRERGSEDICKEDAASPSPSFHECDDGQAEAPKGSTSTCHDCLPSSAATAAVPEDASLRAKPGEDQDPNPEGCDDGDEHYEEEYEEEQEDDAEQSGFRWISEAELLGRSTPC